MITNVSRPVLFLMFITALNSLLVMPVVNGPVSDVGARSRVAHWLWTGDMVAPRQSPTPSDDPNVLRFPAGLPGRRGTLYPWYGVGQSLLLIPADILATGVGTVIKRLKGEHIRMLMVWYLFFPLFNGLGIVAVYLLLCALGFNPTHAILGALSVLFATTYLWHVQNIQENNQQFLFTILAFWCVLGWLRTDQARWLTLAAVLVGFNLLIRLTTIADVAGVVIFALLLSKDRKRLVRSLGARFAPPIVCYLLLDRIYHWFRFGSLTGTYMGLYGEQFRQLNPWLPPSFPFNGAFVGGFLGVFFSPAKSIFIYDPLLLLTAGVVIWQWRRLTPLCRAYLIAMSLILIATAAGYAKYYNWDGEACWGNRFTTTPVFGMALLAVPLALPTRLPKAAIIGFVALACCIQASSLIFPSWVELVQNGRGQERFVLLPGCLHSTEYFVLGQRVRNIWLWATTGRIAATCDGQSTGNPPLSLWPLLPLKTISAEVRLLARASWLLIFSVMLVCAWRVITPRGRLSP